MKYFDVKLAIIGHETRNKEISIRRFGGKKRQPMER